MPPLYIKYIISFLLYSHLFPSRYVLRDDHPYCIKVTRKESKTLARSIYQRTRLTFFQPFVVLRECVRQQLRRVWKDHWNRLKRPLIQREALARGLLPLQQGKIRKRKGHLNNKQLLSAEQVWWTSSLVQRRTESTVDRAMTPSSPPDVTDVEMSSRPVSKWSVTNIDFISHILGLQV